MINFGIIGCGGISGAHFNAIKACEDPTLSSCIKGENVLSFSG